MHRIFSNDNLLKKMEVVTREIIISKFDQKIVWNLLLQEYLKILDDQV